MPSISTGAFGIPQRAVVAFSTFILKQVFAFYSRMAEGKLFILFS